MIIFLLKYLAPCTVTVTDWLLTSDHPPWRCTVMGQISLFGATWRKYPWREKKHIHVWIPLSYHGSWRNHICSWLGKMTSIWDHNLHIILGAAGTQLLTVNPITANHVNKHSTFPLSCCRVSHFIDCWPAYADSHCLPWTTWTTSDNNQRPLGGPTIATITACTSRPTLDQVFTGRGRGRLKCMRSYEIWRDKI